MNYFTRFLKCQVREIWTVNRHCSFRANLVNEPSCSCGHPCGNAEHFLFWCPNYTNSRLILLRSMNWYHTVTLDILMFG